MPQTSKAGILGLCLLAGLGLAYALTGLPVLFPPPAHQARTVSGPVPAARPDPRTAILERNVLDLDNPRRGPLTAGADAQPRSWPVIGTVTGRMPLAAVVIDGQTGVFALGDEAAGWRLEEVLPASVVWTSQGRRVEVELSGAEGSGPDVQGAGQTSAPSAGAGAARISEHDLNETLANPGAILQQAAFRPYAPNGKIEGFQVRNIKPGSIIERAGLKHDDVIERINGEPVNGPEKLLTAFKALSGAGYVSIDILRGGGKTSLAVNLE